MLVKCRYCGRKLERNNAFKVVVGVKSKSNTYYCNEEEYLSLKKDNEDRSNIYLLINRIFGYTVINTVLYKEISEIHEVYSYSFILKYIRDNLYRIENIMNKNFTSELAKIKYFTAVLRNNIHDYENNLQKEILEEAREIEIDMPEVTYTKKKKRRSLAEIESEVD